MNKVLLSHFIATLKKVQTLKRNPYSRFQSSCLKMMQTYRHGEISVIFKMTKALCKMICMV